SGAGNATVPIRFQVVKPVAATVTKVGTWGATNCGQPNMLSVGTAGFGYQVAVTGAGQFTSQNTAGNFTLEANP
ncbi:MAG TPA: hypothetical protein VNG04_07430, partial [Candidatus Acidoferrum sp.]|nr:hypothetical protein [Candidatus Acidoferrum sp.]